jgi:hypothetical protein
VEGVGPDTARGSNRGDVYMEANLLAAEPTALALGELEHGYGEHQPEADASENSGKEADVGRRAAGGFPIHRASIALVAVVQLLWIGLLVYGTYLAVEWFPL